MIPELGQFSLILACILAVIQCLCPLIGRLLGNKNIIILTEGASRATFLLVSIAFGALMTSHIQSDFSVTNVWKNSHQTMPLLYRVTGTWGSHEGSMMLWVLVLTFCSALVSWLNRRLPFDFYTTVLAVQGSLSALFLVFVALTSNPFTRIEPAPESGLALNPILQDIGLALHPPLLYLGYVGFSIAFSFAVAGLIEGRIDKAWAGWVRPWSLAAWVALTLGIALGSYWAYYELGWGGWWFWDPVENASLMPWLLGTALVHMLIVVEKRNSLKSWAVCLAVSTFLLCLLGTFIVRSGLITSVHNFANDPVRGLYILALMTLVAVVGFGLFAWRASTFRDASHFDEISREGALIANNFGLMVVCLTVLVGTLYPVMWPLFSGEEGASLSIGEPFYEKALYPLVLGFLVLTPIGPLLAWKRVSSFQSLKALGLPLALVVFFQIIFFLLVERVQPMSAIGFGLGIWLTVGAFAEIGRHLSISGFQIKTALRRLRGLNSQYYATAFGHAGVGLCLLGLSIAGSQQSETILLLDKAQIIPLGDVTLRFEGLENVEGPNYKALVGKFTVLGENQSLSAAKRFYPERAITTTEAGILTRGLSQIYVSLGDLRSDNSISARLYVKPFVLLIWLGALVMAFGGFLSIVSGRRNGQRLAK